MKLILLLNVLVAACVIGCQRQVDDPPAGQHNQPAADKPNAPGQGAAAESQDSEEVSSWKKVNRLYEQAKSSGQTTAVSAKEWVAELYGDASSASKQAAIESAGWLADMYEKAKESGETATASSTEWLAEDASRHGTWQYKTLIMDSVDAEAVENALNQLGSERWECFWVDKQQEQTTFYLKQERRSYLRQLPLRHLLLLIPLLRVGASSD